MLGVMMRLILRLALVALLLTIIWSSVARAASDDDSDYDDGGPSKHVATAPTIIVPPSGNPATRNPPAALSMAPAAPPLAASTENDGREETKTSWDWSAIQASPVWHWPWNEGLLVLFNGLLALFALRLIKVGRTQAAALAEIHNMSKEMAVAANRSAEAAERSAEAVNTSAVATKGALNIDRPFLIADGLTFQDEELQRLARTIRTGTTGNLTIEKQVLKPAAIQVSFTVTNYGKGPAIIESIKGRVTVVSELTDVPHDDFGGCEEWIRKKRVLGVGTHQMVYSPILPQASVENPNSPHGWLSEAQIQAILGESAFLVAYGRIAYRDYLLSTTFYSDFFWLYSAMPLRADQRGMALPGPEERNRYL